MTGLSADLCFRGTNEAKAKTKQGPNSAPRKAWPSHTHTRGLGAARRGWSGGSMLMEMRAFLQVLSVHRPQLMTIHFLAYGDQEGENVGQKFHC